MIKNRSVPDVRLPSSEGTAGSRRSFMLALCEFSRERAGISHHHLRRTQGADAKPGESNGTYPTCINDLGAIARPARLTRAILGTQLFGGFPAACCGPSCDFCQDESGFNSFMDLAIVSVFFPRSFSYKTPSAPTINVFTPDER